MPASRSLLSTGPQAPPLEDPSAPPIFSIGFRPFFLLATLLAVLWIPAWLAILDGVRPQAHFPDAALHSHEMIFGFTVAVIAGFLLTAGANWTGLPTTSGSSLLLLTMLWLAGRVAMLSSFLPNVVVAFVDLSFLPALASALVLPLLRSSSQRNYQFLAMVGLLTCANAMMHLGVPLPDLITQDLVSRGQTLALRVVTFMILVMGGRIIPMFTRNATSREGIRQVQSVDRLALAAFLVAALLDLLVGSGKVAGVLLVIAGGLHVLRMRTWGTLAARKPLLWILHFGYASVALSLVLEGLAGWDMLPRTVALHLLTVGGIAGLCLGMMTRVSLGHSGRMLVAPTRMTLAFAALVAATCVRVVGPLVAPSAALLSYQLSGVLWTLAFLLLLVFGLPIWFRPRVDRK